MIETSRHRRAQLRTLTREVRARRRAVKAIATGAPQPARTHLVAAGLDTVTATRFVAAFSRSVLPTATGTTRRKLKGRVVATLPVKLYDIATFAARLAVYRPRDTAAAAQFAALAQAA